MLMRALIFMGSSRDDIRTFPESARREMGRQLLRVQLGLDPENWKPMKTVGKGVREVRILHAFRKKGQKTSLQDIKLGQQRFKQIGE